MSSTQSSPTSTKKRRLSPSPTESEEASTRTHSEWVKYYQETKPETLHHTNRTSLLWEMKKATQPVSVEWTKKPTSAGMGQAFLEAFQALHQKKKYREELLTLEDYSKASRGLKMAVNKHLKKITTGEERMHVGVPKEMNLFGRLAFEDFEEECEKQVDPRTVKAVRVEAEKWQTK